MRQLSASSTDASVRLLVRGSVLHVEASPMALGGDLRIRTPKGTVRVNTVAGEDPTDAVRRLARCLAGCGFRVEMVPSRGPQGVTADVILRG